MCKVSIKSNDGITNILIDDKPIENIVSFKLTQEATKIPLLILEIIPSEIELEGTDIQVEKKAYEPTN